jgi:hypothetical protein
MRIYMSPFFGAAAAAIVVSFPKVVGAQQSGERVIGGAQQCASCTLTARHVVTLGSASDSVFLSEGTLIPPGIAPDGSYLTDGTTSTNILVFDAAGKLRRVVGRFGQGPNEFPRGFKWFFPARLDTTYVIVNGRVFVLDGNLGESRRMPVPQAPGYVVMGNGGIATVQRYDLNTALIVNVVAANGARTSEIKVRDAYTVPELCSRCKAVSLTAANQPDQFWLLHSNGFLLQRWASDGRLVESVRVQGSPWHDEWLRIMRTGWGGPDDRMPALEVRRRSDGLLLVSAQGPTSARDAPDTRSTKMTRSMAANFMALERGLDQVFVILDPARGTLATTRLQQRGFRLMHDGRHAMRLIESTDGVVQFEIWELVFAPG